MTHLVLEKQPGSVKMFWRCSWYYKTYYYFIAGIIS